MQGLSFATSAKKYLMTVLKTPVRIFKLNNKMRVGIAVLSIIFLIVIFEPVINGFLLEGRHPLSVGSFKPLLPPSQEHFLGTDILGRDVLGEVLHGLRYSFSIGIIAGTISTAIGIIVALMAGYKGGIYDTILRTATDMMLVIPMWPIMATLAAYLRFMSIYTMALLLAVFTWPWAARTIRSQVMSLKERPYIDLAKTTDLRDIEITFEEILPNVLPYLGAGFATAVVGAIIAETALEMVGLGPGNIQTLGTLIQWAINFGAVVMGNWLILAAPILFLVLVFISFNLINIGLDEAYNPRLKKITGL